MRNVVRALKARLIARWPCRWPPSSWGFREAAAARTHSAVAHRGGGTATHSNTISAKESLPAFDWAVKNGADIIDISTHKDTSDNQLVVMHR